MSPVRSFVIFGCFVEEAKIFRTILRGFTDIVIANWLAALRCNDLELFSGLSGTFESTMNGCEVHRYKTISFE